eukprot:1263657-Pyramimonas_sp.AAC.1
MRAAEIQTKQTTAKVYLLQGPSTVKLLAPPNTQRCRQRHSGEKRYEDTLEGLRRDGWEPFRFWGSWVCVWGPELDKLLEDIHMIAVGKADECIQEEILSHEEISGLTVRRRFGGYKWKDVEQLEGSPRKKTRNSLTVHQRPDDASVHKPVKRRKGKRRK